MSTTANMAQTEIELPVGPEMLKAKPAVLGDLEDAHTHCKTIMARSIAENVSPLMRLDVYVQAAIAESKPQHEQWREISLPFVRFLVVRCIQKCNPHFTQEKLDSLLGNDQNTLYKLFGMVNPAPLPPETGSNEEPDPTPSTPTSETP